MSVNVEYPEIVTLDDGRRIRTTERTWKERRLMVETDRSEEEVRDMFHREGFGDTFMEYPKSGRLGHGVVKEAGDWQVHFRFMQHGDNILVDGEVEVSKKYVEHLNHGWLPAFDICTEMFTRHFGGFWVYHKGYRRYVTNFVRNKVLSLANPESKTNTVVVCIGIALALGVAVATIMSQRD